MRRDNGAAALAGNEPTPTTSGTDRDGLLERITEFACGVSYADLPDEVIQAARERIVDAIGCGIGALTSEAAAAGRRVATLPDRDALAGRIFGSSDVVSGQDAAFINGCMIRDLDLSDTYPGGHPSDMLGGLLAIGSPLNARGSDLIAAVVVGYEIFMRLQDAGEFQVKGWDQGLAVGIGAVAAMGRLLRLDRDRMREAIAINTVANVPMRATRAGELSMWKGASTAYHMRNSVFSAELAAVGVTGPESPFEGRHGMMEQVTGQIEVAPFGMRSGGYVVRKAKIKYWPVAYSLQALVWAGLELREKLAGREPVSIRVGTFWFSYRESGSEPAKWDPRTRETADHSAPYILARTLRDGTIDARTFTPECYLDPTMRPLMDIIEVGVDDDLEELHPATFKMRVEARDVDSNDYLVEIVNPLGHEDNPMGQDSLSAKFRGLAERHLRAVQTDRLLDCLWSIDDRPLSAVMDLTVPLATE